MMSLEIKKHFRRYEVKYLIPENYADKIIPSILEHMEIDPYAKNLDYYDCYSCYFDTYDLQAYQAVKRGQENRRKCRIRCYDLMSKSGFLEVKQKQGNVITKDREIISFQSFQKILSHPILAQSQGWDSDFSDTILEWLWREKLVPQVWVKCRRKPFISPLNSSFRVTIDYDLAFMTADSLAQTPTDWYKKYEKKVILESKFTNKMPLWFKNIIDTYKLESQGFSKYCVAIDTVNKR